MVVGDEQFEEAIQVALEKAAEALGRIPTAAEAKIIAMAIVRRLNEPAAPPIGGAPYGDMS